MTCNKCGEKPKKACGTFPKAVIEIGNPEQITLLRKVIIPASMGDDTTVPPAVGKYHNVLLYYEANQKSYLYSSDGIPTQLVNGITNYEDATNLPQINGVTLLGDKSAADLELADAPMVINVANGNTSWSGADTAEDVYNFFLNKGKVNIIFNGEENYSYEIASAAYIPEEEKMMCTLAVATIAAGEPTEFEGNALFGTMTLYTADKAIDVSQIELQPKLYVADFTGLDLNYNELSGVPATNYSIGMVKPGDGLEVDTDGTMSISGIEQYAHFFDTVADMKAANNLVAGDYARTGGFYAVNDGGDGLFKIREITNEDVVDETFIYEMDGGNDLIAELIIDESMNVKQFGVKADGVTDNYNKLSTILSKCDVLYFPNGTYCVNTKLDVTDCFTIKGEDKSKTIIKAPNGFITWTGSKSKTITSLHINGVAVDNVNNNIGIEGGLSFGKIEDVKISNYYIAYKPLSGTWISTFQNININACTNGFNNPSLTTFNNCKLSGVTFQHLTGICFDVMGSIIEMNECNFEDCNVCIAKAPTLMNITSCFFEGNVRILDVASGGLASYFIIEKSRLLPTNTEALANGWLACLPTMSSVDATTAVLEIKDCEIDNRTKDTIKPFAFQGTYNQTYWGVSIGNNSFKNIKTTNQYNIYYDDLFDTTNCTNYGTDGNPTQFYSVIPMYSWQGITWLRSSLGNMQGAHRHNYSLRIVGKYSVTKTSGDITITPPKKYFGVPSQSDFPVTVLFTDGTMDYGKMTITPTEITVTPINYNGRTTSKIIFDNTYSRRFAQYW